jgi:hypothetical protein
MKNQEYRLYYDGSGFIYKAAKVDSDVIESMPYIVVDRNTFKDQSSYNVVNGKLVKRSKTKKKNMLLRKSDKGYKTIKNHAAILLQENESYPYIDYYEYKHN